MVIDTSAIVAILLNEPEALRLETALVADQIRLVPATCVLEVRMGRYQINSRSGIAA